jgi:GntR family transcriptional regulator/MocR family aminotransferase
VPVDDEGLCIAQGAARWPDAKLAVVTPTHQFPLGVRMSLHRRTALIDWARAQRAWIVEDDYDGEFQYGAQRIPALCSMAHDARVLYVGTFSKSLGAGLRLGFIVLPDALVEAFTRARALSDRQSPGAAQDVLARFIADGHLLRHLRRMRELYRERQGAMIHNLIRATGGAIAPAPSAQGMHLAFEIGERARDTELSQRAEAAGVQLAPISLYCIEAKRRGWLFGYAGYGEAALARAARVLARQMN